MEGPGVAVAIDPRQVSLSLSIGLLWANAERARVAVAASVLAAFDDEELSAAVGMTASELTENAIKYGEWGLVAAHAVELRVESSSSAVIVEVKSPVAEGSPQLEGLLSVIAWIQSASTPGEAYAERVLAIASTTSPPMSTGSQMGLVRIACEARADLDARIEAGPGCPMLAVRASIPIIALR